MGDLTEKATVVITTKNRKDDLRRAVISALNQDGSPQVLVMDDASTDGTCEMMRSEFPQVRVIGEGAVKSTGYIVQRNRAAKLATTPIIFSLDDDAEYSTPNIVRKIVEGFNDDRIGAIAIPFMNVRDKSHAMPTPPNADAIYLAESFVGTAYAVRRELFNRLGGYREFFFHQGEEEDFSIRMLDAGFVVRLGSSDPIHHFESENRDNTRINLYGRRNNILFTWCNVPLPFFLAHLPATTVNGFRIGLRQGKLGVHVRGLAMGFAGIVRHFRQRKPVRGITYRRFRILRAMPVKVVSYISWIED
jgi:GT2 family glycosyltransferase